MENLALKKVELIEWLTKIEDQALLEQIEAVRLKAISEKQESKLKTMTSTEYHAMLAQAEEDFKNGRVTSQEDFEKEAPNW